MNIVSIGDIYAVHTGAFAGEMIICVGVEGKDYCFNTNIGDAILLFGADKYPHWRNQLQCNENERVIQLFLHWKSVNHISKKIKSLL